MAALRKAKGKWLCDLQLKCPYCHMELDSTDVPAEPGEEYRGEVECPYCDKDFITSIDFYIH